MFVFVCVMAVLKCPECSAPGTRALKSPFKKLLTVTFSRICVFCDELGFPWEFQKIFIEFPQDFHKMFMIFLCLSLFVLWLSWNVLNVQRQALLY